MGNQRLRDLLSELGLSQLGTARLLGVSGRTVRLWIAGERPVPHAAMVLLLLLRDKRIAQDEIEDRKIEAEEFDRKFDAGEDVDQHVEWSKAQRLNQ